MQAAGPSRMKIYYYTGGVVLLQLLPFALSLNAEFSKGISADNLKLFQDFLQTSVPRTIDFAIPIFHGI
jgi:hypothetical protein